MKRPMPKIYPVMLILVAVTAASLVALLADTTLCRSAPVTFIIIIIVIMAGTAVMIRNRRHLPLLRNLRLRGRMVAAPLVLLLLALPAAITYISYELSGSEPLLLLAELFAALTAAICLPVAAVVTIPAIISAATFPGKTTSVDGEKRVVSGSYERAVSGYDAMMAGGGDAMVVRGGDARAVNMSYRFFVVTAIMMLLAAVITPLTGVALFRMVQLLPVMAIAMIMLAIIAAARFSMLLSTVAEGFLAAGDHPAGRKPATITADEALPAGDHPAVDYPGDGEAEPWQGGATGEPQGGGRFAAILLAADHHLDLLSGRHDYLRAEADNDYATAVAGTASHTFDPALVPALRVIAAEERFSDKVRQMAETGAALIELYHSDPVRHSGVLRMPGISEESARVRGILHGRSRPHEQEVASLMGSASEEIRKIAVTAAGTNMATSLSSEVIKALNSKATAREAYYTLRQFGPEIYGDQIGAAVKGESSEAANYIVLRLLEAMPLPDALPWLATFIATGYAGVRLRAAASLREREWVPEGRSREMVEGLLIEAVHTEARLITTGQEARRKRYFLLSEAVRYERRVNRELISSLLELLAGEKAARLMMHITGNDTRWQAEIASEAVDELMGDSPVSRPLRALLGNSPDSDRVTELSLYFPLRDVRERHLISLLLTSEQNITGTWTKACALHVAATEGRGLEADQAVSFLFSNSQLLQEESARAMRRINTRWYHEAETRLPAQVRERISSIISGELPRAAMIFEKTRFLSLCFKEIPEEKIIMLATDMRYSESVDAEALPDILSWVVPSVSGKTGLYTLPLEDVAEYLFYYPEYTEVLVNYVDSQVGVTIT